MTSAPSRRFFNPKPTKHGSIGHPEKEGAKLFRCAGVVFYDRARMVRWSLRIYAPTEKTAQFTIWHRANGERRHSAVVYGLWGQVLEQDLPAEVVEFGWAWLTYFRLRGRVSI